MSQNRFVTPAMAAMKEYPANSVNYKIRLDANESPFLPDEAMRKKIADAAANTALNRYPDPMAAEVVKAYARYIGVAPQLITAGNGSDELIGVLVSGFFAHGDKLLITPPDFSMYEFYAQLKELCVIAYPREESSYKIPLDDLIKFINEQKPRAVIFSNPANPLGQGYGKSEILRLVSSVDALCIIDEAYMDFYGDSVVKEVESYDNLIVLRTASKSAGLAGARLGFAVTNRELSDQIKKIKSPFNVNSFTQAIGCVILEDIEMLNAKTKAIVDEKRRLEDQLSAVIKGTSFELIPTVTNFALMRSKKDASAVFEALKAKDILIRCLKGEYLRITAGTREEDDTFLEAFREIVKEL